MILPKAVHDYAGSERVLQISKNVSQSGTPSGRIRGRGWNDARWFEVEDLQKTWLQFFPRLVAKAAAEQVGFGGIAAHIGDGAGDRKVGWPQVFEFVEF